MITFTVPGNPVAQGRPRFFRRGRFVGTYTPKKTADYKAKVISFARESRIEITTGPLAVFIDLFFKRPKYMYRECDPAESIPCYKRPDVDNCAKIFLDALNGIAWDDDGEVHSLRVTKWYHEKGGEPRADVTIAQLDVP